MASQVLTDGNDIAGATQANVYALGGDDIVYAQGENIAHYNIYGDEGNDYIDLFSDVAVASFYGGGGNDVLSGDRGADYLYGGAGDDLLVGGAIQFVGDEVRIFNSRPTGDDVLTGDDGTDALYGFDGNDVLYGGDGDDSGVIVVSDAGHTTHQISAGLFGVSGDDILDGGRGNDFLDGGSDADTILGGDGNDTIEGGVGKDTLTGGAGSDLFLFDTQNRLANINHITDFTHGVDKLALSHTYYPKLAVGALPESALKDIISGTIDADDRILYNHNTGVLYYDPDGSGLQSAHQFATLEGHPTLTASDFTVIA